MDIAAMSTEKLCEIVQEMKEKLAKYEKSDDYNWYLANKNRSKLSFAKYREYLRYLDRCEKIRIIYHGLKANINCIEYEIYTRENSNVLSLEM